VSLSCCPKPYITAESQALVEEFFVWRRIGLTESEWNARQVEAFAILERELSAESERGAQART
jgi:hypothetical protein